ncbi:hypothetical protein PAXRUDRAFT_14865 [Paxillus rubicundulus Ve08.2h10]|uniref:Uncharacterized protein n=1 Tax=Paxillus rubicundulus Ve08.2h10 TaxID=930991 RepID=A0A0D0DRB0_9AGAM|nr:hypothetical protein PAXRUDRAFT_14865 [Paxillus rubicundulus Ve08.2h10]
MAARTRSKNPKMVKTPNNQTGEPRTSASREKKTTVGSGASNTGQELEAMKAHIAMLTQNLQKADKAKAKAELEAQRKETRKWTQEMLEQDGDTDDRSNHDTGAQASRPMAKRPRTDSDKEGIRSLLKDDSDEDQKMNGNRSEEDVNGEGPEVGGEGNEECGSKDDVSFDFGEIVVEEEELKKGGLHAWSVASSGTTTTTTTKSNTSTSTSGSCRGALDGCLPTTSRVMTRGHAALHLHIATVDGFLATRTKMEIAWASMKEGAEDFLDLTKKLMDIGQDSVWKEKDINYVWSAGSQIQGKLISKAQLKISASYSILGSLKPKEITEAVEWLI